MMRDTQFSQLRDDDYDMLMVASWTQKIEDEVYARIETGLEQARANGRDRQFLVGALVPLTAAIRDICVELDVDVIEAFSEIADRFDTSHLANRKKANG